MKDERKRRKRVTWFKNHWTIKGIALFLAVGLIWGGQSILPRETETDLEGLFKWAVKNYLEGKYREVGKDLELLLSYCDEDHNQLKGKIHLLLGAAYEQLGNLREARKNYRLSQELLETYSIEGVDLTLLEEYRHIFMKQPQPLGPGIIVKPKKKPAKRKLSPLLLVLGGVAVAGVAALLVLKKDKPAGAATINYYILTLTVEGQGKVTLDPAGGIYPGGTSIRLEAIPDPGWEFYSWYTNAFVTENPTHILMNSNKEVIAVFRETGGITKTFGHLPVFLNFMIEYKRAALPLIMPEDGTIHGITMYHLGGTGRMILAVYDGTTFPQNRLGLTPETNVDSSNGWQTINLTSPVHARGGQTIWLAWVYENSPGFAFKRGTPGIVISEEGWGGGMPEQFGGGTRYINEVYLSIYATYTPD